MEGRPVLKASSNVQGIRVNSVNPTVVATDMGQGLCQAMPDGTAEIYKRSPLGRFAQSVAGIVCQCIWVV